MQRQWLAVLFVPLVVLLAPAARAQEAPTVVVRVKSLDALLQNLNLVVKLVGQEEAANQIEGLIKSKIGKKGLEGVDTTRPFGAYVRFGKTLDEINGAILVPMIDEKTFLGLLENLSIEVTKDKNDIYTHKTGKGFDLYFRFANRYLYITSVGTESIQLKNLIDPAKALAITGDATISVVARIDQIPDDAKLFALAALDGAIVAAQQKKEPNESKVQQEFRVALLKEFNKLGAGIIREAAELRFNLDISDATKEMTVNFSVTGKPGSDLAKSIQAVGNLKSPLAGLATKDIAFQGSMHLALPDALKQSLNSLIDEAAAKSLASIENATKKKQAEALFEAILPTAKAGDFQVVAAILGPKADRYTIVAGLKLKDGVKLGNTVHGLIKDAIKDIPPEFRDKIALDIDSVGTVKIHKFELSNLSKDANTAKLLDLFGDSNIYIAFRDDALLVAMGTESLATLKSAIAKTGSVPSQPLVFDFDLARMAKWTVKTPEQKELAAKLFPGGENGRVRLSIEGGAALTARLQMRLSVLEFLAKLKKDQE
jgi:hypothetical protein